LIITIIISLPNFINLFLGYWYSVVALFVMLFVVIPLISLIAIFILIGIIIVGIIAIGLTLVFGAIVISIAFGK